MPEKINSRKSLQDSLEESELDSAGWRIYDFTKNNQGVRVAIIRVYLSHYESFRQALSGNEGQLKKYGIKSITSSGKIKLVRERMGLEKPKRKR